MLDILKTITKGNSKAISISKTRKIILIKKKWREKGIRDLHLGSNPHSNGEDFSRSINLFFEIKLLIIINNKHKTKIRIEKK